MVNSIRAARISAGLTQDELGRRTKIDRTTICRVERGYRNPTDKQRRAIAEALGQSEDFLFKEDRPDTESF